MKRILIFGATGRTGRLALDYALSDSKQLEVCALVRSPEKLRPRPGLTLVPGTPYERGDVERAIDGCDAVLSFLGHSGLRALLGESGSAPPDLMARSTQNALTAMLARGLRRIVVLSAFGAGDSRRVAPRALDVLIERAGVLRASYADHEAQEVLLRATELDWTSVRAVLLAGRDLTRTRLSEHGKPKPRAFISRRTVATFMVDCLLHPEFYQKALIASAD